MGRTFHFVKSFQQRGRRRRNAPALFVVSHRCRCRRRRRAPTNNSTLALVSPKTRQRSHNGKEMEKKIENVLQPLMIYKSPQFGGYFHSKMTSSSCIAQNVARRKTSKVDFGCNKDVAKYIFTSDNLDNFLALNQTERSKFSYTQ